MFYWPWLVWKLFEMNLTGLSVLGLSLFSGLLAVYLRLMARPSTFNCIKLLTAAATTFVPATHSLLSLSYPLSYKITVYEWNLQDRRSSAFHSLKRQKKLTKTNFKTSATTIRTNHLHIIDERKPYLVNTQWHQRPSDDNETGSDATVFSCFLTLSSQEFVSNCALVSVFNGLFPNSVFVSNISKTSRIPVMSIFHTDIEEPKQENSISQSCSHLFFSSIWRFSQQWREIWPKPWAQWHTAATSLERWRQYFLYFWPQLPVWVKVSYRICSSD